MPTSYVCKKCGQIHSEEEYVKTRFCMGCGKYRFDVSRVRSDRSFCLPREETATYCTKYGISTLYHITPMENIPTIMRLGLLSHNQVKQEKLTIVSCSNPEIQEYRAHKLVAGQSANDFIPLFFAEKPPMLWQIEKKHPDTTIVYVCIQGEIIGEKGVCFSDGNIADKDTTVYFDLEDLARLDWNLIRTFDEYTVCREEAKRIKAAEVLVHTRIDPSWFQKLVVPTPKAKLKLQALFPLPIPIEIKPEFYHNPRSRRY